MIHSHPSKGLEKRETERYQLKSRPNRGWLENSQKKRSWPEIFGLWQISMEKLEFDTVLIIKDTMSIIHNISAWKNTALSLSSQFLMLGFVLQHQGSLNWSCQRKQRLEASGRGSDIRVKGNALKMLQHSWLMIWLWTLIANHDHGGRQGENEGFSYCH